MPKLQIITNVPADVRLLTTEAEARPSQYASGGLEFMYRTDGGDLYVPTAVGPIFAESIAKHGIRPNDPVRVLKAATDIGGGRKAIRWSLTPLTSAGEQSNGTLAVPRMAPQAAAPVPQAMPAPLPMTRPVTKLEDALKTVVAAVYAAQQYAREIGFNAMPPFTSEDIRTMANTLVIEEKKRNAA